MDRNERFRGRLMSGDKIVLESITGLLKTHRRAGGSIGEWTGHFEMGEDQRDSVVEGNRYRIVLIDGRSGTVAVRMREDSEAPHPVVQFHGTGSFRN